MKFTDMAEKPKKKRPLTDQQALFVAEYMKDRNATQAAIRAGYSAKNAESIGYQLLQKTPVREKLNEAMSKQLDRLRWDADRTLLEITRMAAFDPKDLANLSGPQDIANLPEDVRRAIVGWGYDKLGNFTIKLAKESALQMLGKHFKLFTDVIEVKDESALSDRMNKARKRAKGKE